MTWEPYGQQEVILVVSHDVVGEQMAGPGIRYYHLSRVLSSESDVLLALPCVPSADLETGHLRLVQYTRGDWSTLAPLVKNARVLILNSVSIGDFPQLVDVDVPLVVDGYDPLLAEWMALNQDQPIEMEKWWSAKFRQLSLQYQAGDFFICASERQRDWWLGLLEASGRINPWNLRADPSFRRLVDVVPFGVPNTPPKHIRPVIRSVWPGIGENDRLLLWGGGLWPWMDPLTAVRAVAIVQQSRQDVRLVFPGTKHPNPVMAGMPTHTNIVQEEARRLGILNKAVFFGEWVPYPDWANVLLESDLALSLHFADTLETRWAFRTRVLDNIWAGLPVIATRGDATSEIISLYGVGTLVDSQDSDGVARAILETLERPRRLFESGFEAARNAFSWDRVAQPLIEFCRHPQKSPDKTALGGNANNLLDGQRSMALLKEENDSLRALVKAYEQRKIVRLLNWTRRFWGGSATRS